MKLVLKCDDIIFSYVEKIYVQLGLNTLQFLNCHM
jgi:hypothetical protein